MADRYFVETRITSDRATLAGAEAHHLAHVMRAKAGTPVVLFDGSGVEFRARVQRVGRLEVELAVVSRADVNRELAWQLTLGVALPKGVRQRWLVEKATELGVTRLVPLQTARGVTQPGAKALGRLRRVVVEASKQCGRNRLLDVTQPQTWADFLAGADLWAGWRAIADPGGTQPASSLVATPSAGECGDSLVLAVGPEGGFTAAELAVARANGWHVLHLGPRVLRVETAAICLAAMVATARG